MQSEELLELAQTSLEDMKARDLRTLDVRSLTSVTDYLLIASGTSDRHIRSLSEKLIQSAKEAGQPPLGVEGQDAGEWVLIDLQDVIVQPNHLGKCHRQEAITHVKDAFLGDRVLRVSENQLHSVRQPVLHHSVVDRIYEDREYVPLPLMRERRIHPYTGELVNHCVWYETGIVDNFESLTTHRISGSRPLIRLAVGKSHKFTVYANQKFNSSGLLVNKGEKYSFKINMKQRWFDANISAGPDGWDRKGQDLSLLKDVVIRFSENDRRCPEARWFEVVGCINKSDDVVFRLLNRTKSKPYSVPLKGELFAFANDVGDRYGNNLGTIKVGVTRIA